MRWWVCAAPFVAAVTLAACGRPATVSSAPSAAVFSLAGQYAIPHDLSASLHVRVGGLSGLASLGNGHELLALADDRDHPRVFRMAVNAETNAFRVDVSGILYLQPAAGAPTHLDPEGIAVTPDGHMLITSEGAANDETRLPPAILEYASDGAFIRPLPVRGRYAPSDRGPVTAGVRDNAGFEALTLSPDAARLFTATELPLAQDGEATTFAPGARARLLEYRATGGSFEPAREFVYEIDPIPRPPFEVRFAIAGVVELLSLGGNVLLAMERGFVESVDRKESMNTIRLFRIDFSDATDVSNRESLLGATGIVPVRKALVLDVNALRGLAPPLTRLDNFEGMAWGPATADGIRTLILVSDDNFSERQVTGFLLLRPGRRSLLPRGPRVSGVTKMRPSEAELLGSGAKPR